jgi:TfoX/Sxy family transcriptional regulator of competence genes
MQAADTAAAFDAALPDDPRVSRKRMFGTPCAFVNRQMFFGTFENTLVARVGERRAKLLSDQPGVRIFSPSEGKVWTDTLQVELTLGAPLLAALAKEALAWAAALPRKAKAPTEVRRAKRRAKKAKRSAE